MANQNAGGLFATVSLDISAAMDELDKIDRKLKSVFSTTGASRGQTGLTRLNRSATQVTRSVDRAGNSLDRAEKRTRRFGRTASKAGKDTEGLSQSVKAVGDNLSTTLASFGAARSGNYFYALSSGVQAVTRGFRGATKNATIFGASLAAVIGIAAALIVTIGGVGAALVKLGRTSVTSGAQLETLAVSFEALLGSAARARQELNFIIRAAEISPFFTKDIIALNRFLLAQGLLNDQLRQGTTKALIDFGAAAGLTGDRLRDLGYALGQVYNAGRLTGDEARQLRNNFLGAEQVLRTLPRYAELSGLEIKKAMEEGRISSADFFEAFFAFTSRFQGAAEAQARTLNGLKDTLVDVFQLGLGEANLTLDKFGKNLSLLSALKQPLAAVLEVVKDLDFRPLVASLAALVNSILGPLSAWLRGDAQRIKTLFEDTIPKGILGAANLIRVLGGSVFAVFKALGNVISQWFRLVLGGFVGVGDGANGFILALKGVGYAAVIIGGVLAAIFTKIAVKISLAVGLVEIFLALLQGGFSAAGRAAANAVVRTTEIVAGAAAGVIDAWNAVGQIQPLTYEDLFPNLTELDDKIAQQTAQAGETFGDSLFGAGDNKEGESAAGKATKAANDVAKAMDEIFNLTRRWFDLRSDLEEGFLGPEGFTATVTQIAGLGQRLIEALQTIGDPAAIRQVEDATFELIGLARSREKAAEALSAAERQLAEAIKARDDFASKVRQQALDFANAFRTEEETVRSFQEFSERGFFFEVEKKQQKSFVESLKERLKATKDFLKNIKLLRSQGLNEGLLQELLLAGPEAGGVIAEELANGGQAVVDEVNVLQDAVTQVADELGDYGAGEFFQAGVDIAQAQVDGLRANLDEITAAAESITQTVFDALLPFAQEMEDLGKAAGDGLASGLGEGLGGFADVLGGASTDIGGALDNLSSITSGFGGSVAEGLFAGQGAAVSAVDEFFAGVYEELDLQLGEGNIKMDEGLQELITSFTDAMSGEGPSLQSRWEAFLQRRILNPLGLKLGFIKQAARDAGPNFGSSFMAGLGEIGRQLYTNLQTWLRESVGEPIGRFLIEKGTDLYNWAAGVGDWIVRGLNTIGEIVVELPFRIVNNLGDLLERAINWVIGKYNSFARNLPFLPQISRVDFGISSDFSSGGNSRVTGAGTYSNYQAPSLGSGGFGGGNFASSEPVFNVTVQIGETELNDIVDTRVEYGQTSTARQLVGVRRT